MAPVQTVVNRGDVGLNRSESWRCRGEPQLNRSETVFVRSAVGVLPGWTVVIRVGTVLHQGRWSSVAIKSTKLDQQITVHPGSWPG